MEELSNPLAIDTDSSSVPWQSTPRVVAVSQSYDDDYYCDGDDDD